MVSKSNITLVLGLAALSFALGEHASAGGRAVHPPTAVERVVQVSARASTNPAMVIQNAIDAQAGFELTCVIPMTQFAKLSAVAPAENGPVYELVFKRSAQ